MAEQNNNKINNGEEKDTFLKRLQHRYQVMIFDYTSLSEISNFHITKIRFISYVVFFLLAFALVILVLVIFTPVNRLLPAYHDSELQQQIINNAIRVDSLEYELQVRDRYIENIKRIISGKAPKNYQARSDTSDTYDGISITQNKRDSVLRKELEQEMRSSVQANYNNRRRSAINLDLYLPVNGMVVNSFAPQERHYGVDIVSEKDEPVLSVLAGTVISADWTLETGYVIRVQHKNDLISCYKHNSVLLKEVGDRVTSGETIAIVGNTGEFSSGPHLHFELWYRGKPVNPEDYITF